MPLDATGEPSQAARHHGLEQRACSGRQRRDQPSVQSAEPGTRRGASEHDELVAEQEVLGDDDGARGEESRDGSDYVAKEIDHRAILTPAVWHVQPSRAHAPSSARASSFCGAQLTSVGRMPACARPVLASAKRVCVFARCVVASARWVVASLGRVLVSMSLSAPKTISGRSPSSGRSACTCS
jgi:hypothetical protein